METREKILLYCKRNNISAGKFAESVGESKQNWSKMSTGKTRITIDVLINIRKVYPDIDFNSLLDEDTQDFLVAESKAEYGTDEYKKKLSDEVKKVIKQLEKFTL